MRFFGFRAALPLVSFATLLSSCNNNGLNNKNDGETVSSQEELCESQPEKAPLPSKVINGKTSPELFAISKEQQAAIGALMNKETEFQVTDNGYINFCTATLVRPNVVLSAAHCVASDYPGGRNIPASKIFFAIGPDVGKTKKIFKIKEYFINPGFNIIDSDDTLANNDHAIFILQDPVPADVAKPIEVNFSSAWVRELLNKRVQNVGYGVTEVNNPLNFNTTRYWTTEEVVNVTAGYFTVYGEGKSSVCSGDSGGPALYRCPDGVLRVMGTVSNGEESCVGYDDYARADAGLEWIEQESVAGIISGCLDLTFKGECTYGNTIARWCNDGGVEYENCAESGKFCNADGGGLIRCHEDECGDLDWHGECQGQLARWCDNGQIKERDCARCGQECGESGAMGAYCLD